MNIIVHQVVGDEDLAVMVHGREGEGGLPVRGWRGSPMLCRYEVYCCARAGKKGCVPGHPASHISRAQGKQ